MIKTLRVTSIIAAVVAGGILVFPVIFGLRKNQAMEEFLKAPSVIDKFKETRGLTGKPKNQQTSPLVGQAGLFAKYLNPLPTKTRPRITGPAHHGGPPPPIEPIRTSVKFTLLGTSYNQSNPQESLALINEPGKGIHWVRQSERVGHLTLEIKDGLVTAKAGNKTYDLTVEHKPEINLLAGSSPSSSPPRLPMPGATLNLPGPAPGQDTSGRITGRPRPELVLKPGKTIEQLKADMAQELFSMLKEPGQDDSGAAGTDKPSETTSDKVSSEVDTTDTRITGTEAKDLENLGRELDNASKTGERARILRERKALRERRAEALRKRIERARKAAGRTTKSK